MAYPGGMLVAEEDFDGDGFSNTQEDRAGTDPRDPSSFPHISELNLNVSTPLTVEWIAVAGKRYQLDYSLDLINWQTLAGSIVGDGGTHELSLDQNKILTGSGVPLLRWDNYLTSNFNNLKAYVTAGTPVSSQSSVITRLEVTQTSPDSSNFAQWVRGWLVPSTTGTYTFWLASDDQSELHISTNASPANRRLLALVSTWTGLREWTKFPGQRSAPVSLVANTPYYFEIFHREGSGGDHFSVAWSGPPLGSETPIVIEGQHLSSTGQSPATLLAAGKLFVRLRVDDVDSDRDGVSDYDERLTGFNPSTSTTKPRIQDRDALLAMLNASNSVTAGTSVSRAYETGGMPGRFVIFRSGNLNPMVVNYSVSGTAGSGSDYLALPGSVSFSVGQTRAEIPVHAQPDALVETTETVVLTLNPSAGYNLGNPGSATVAIDDAPDILYLANLRPSGDVRSSGSGTAAVNQAGNALSGKLSISYGNLASAAAGIDFYVSNDGNAGPVVLTFPAGQVASQVWEFSAAGGLTRGQILAALTEGRLWVRVRSAGAPGGEIRGQLVAGYGWQTMPTPPAPGISPTLATVDADASRFLAQASFGPRTAEISAMRSMTFSQWINAQMGLPVTRHRPYVDARRAEFMARPGGSDGWQTPRQEAWWQATITAPDQLRQRMALALSQILVISQFGALDGDHVGTTIYYDMLLDRAFGNYRDLLQEVTVSPMMGTYLSMMRNRKPNPVTGHEPDENYAREIMQLFTIGLNQLHPDGSLKLDTNGLPIATYSQDDVVGLAHIFTGWGPHYDSTNPPRWENNSIAARGDWFQYGRDSLRSMTFYPEFHDNEVRTIAGAVNIAGGLPGEERLDQALDALFEHPNVGPFLAKQLIQRFVTANPSPGYIYRVASVFNDSGNGMRGDLGATLKAILLDSEARSETALNDIGYGKPMEPLLRMSRMFRLFFPNPPKPGDPRYFINLQYSMGEQAPLMSPSVFNFFQPGYVHPGRIAKAGLLSPEFQTLAETTVVNQANLHHSGLYWGIYNGEKLANGDDAIVRAVFPEQEAILATAGLTPAQAQELLIEHLNVRLLGGRMSAALKQDIRTTMASLPSWYGYTLENQRSRIRVMIYLMMTSPEFSTQR